MSGQQHHLTGRPAPKCPYFHPFLAVPLMPAEHAALHASLRAAGLDYPCGCDALDFWRRRSAFQLRHFAAEGRTLRFGPRALENLAQVLDGEGG